MRLFLAIDLPSEKKTELNMQLNKLRDTYPYFRWVPQENYHITLHFIGETRNLERLVNKIREAVFDIPSFHMYSAEAGIFLRQALVMYIGFRQNRILQNLIRRIKENSHSPHLTFARYKVPSKQQYLLIKKKIKKLYLEIDFPVTQITLFDSVIENDEFCYKPVVEFSLNPKD